VVPSVGLPVCKQGAFMQLDGQECGLDEPEAEWGNQLGEVDRPWQERGSATQAR
jgi:hypothetical protein